MRNRAPSSSCTTTVTRSSTPRSSRRWRAAPKRLPRRRATASPPPRSPRSAMSRCRFNIWWNRNPPASFCSPPRWGVNDLMPFAAIDLPIVLLDTCHSCGLDRVQINNHEGAHIAVDYLFSRYGEMPGFLACGNRIGNFQDREDGYYLAAQRNGASAGRAVVHELAADIAGAKQDMLSLIDAGEPLARSYFCSFDAIAQGAMQAFAERGYRIPEDVAFIGFDQRAGIRARGAASHHHQRAGRLYGLHRRPAPHRDLARGRAPSPHHRGVACRSSPGPRRRG